MGAACRRHHPGRAYGPTLPARHRTLETQLRNELRVCAARSRRTNSVGRTRGVGERMGLWRFHPGRSLSGVMIAGQKERREERDPRITVGSVTFCTVDGVIWGR